MTGTAVAHNCALVIHQFCTASANPECPRKDDGFVATHLKSLYLLCMQHNIQSSHFEWVAYMDFKEATDKLFQGLTQKDLANSLDVSLPAIRQARLSGEAKAHRSPPRGWRCAVIRLAEEQVWHYRKLIESLQNERSE
jgi:hypothetical protein